MKNLKDINKSLDTKYCEPYFSKNGKILFYSFNYYNVYYCLLEEKIYSKIIFFPYLYGKNEDDIINELLILEYIKKNNNINYIVFDKKNKQKIIIFNKSIKDINNLITLIYFVLYNDKIINNLKQIFKKNKFILYFIIDFIKLRLNYNKTVSNNKIFVQIFFELFSGKNKNIKKYVDEFTKKHKIYLNKISNYKELYKKLKNIGFVDYYYKKIVPFVLNNYKNILNIYINSKYFKQQKIIIKKKIKNFSNIDIFELIKNNVNKNYNKKYIKNKFIELSKKYNI